MFRLHFTQIISVFHLPFFLPTGVVVFWTSTLSLRGLNGSIVVCINVSCIILMQLMQSGRNSPDGGKIPLSLRSSMSAFSCSSYSALLACSSLSLSTSSSILSSSSSLLSSLISSWLLLVRVCLLVGAVSANMVDCVFFSFLSC